MQKVNKFVDVISKIQEYIKNLDDVMNKARLFDINLAQGNLVSSAKVVVVLMDFSQKMEGFLKDMRGLFARLEPATTFQATHFD